jgi:hypothetical protein
MVYPSLDETQALCIDATLRPQVGVRPWAYERHEGFVL